MKKIKFCYRVQYFIDVENIVKKFGCYNLKFYKF